MVVGKQLLPASVPARQAHTLHPPRTEERTPTFAPKSSHKLAPYLVEDCGRLRCKAKRKAASFMSASTTCVSAGQTGKQLAPALHRRADALLCTAEQP